MAGTLVVSAQGPVPIEAVELGDMVLSRDAATGEQAMRPVTELYRNKTTELIHVDIGKETISATPEHPFWVQGTGWVDATGLSAGDDLRLADGGTATIVSVMRERLESPRDVYNFEVEGFHTYFVASAGVWVHNACSVQVNRKAGLEFERRLGMDAVKRGHKMLDGRTRFPDKWVDGAIEEAKYVKELRWTKQLDDYARLTKVRGKPFVIHLKRSTKIGPKARRMLKQYGVTIRRHSF